MTTTQPLRGTGDPAAACAPANPVMPHSTVVGIIGVGDMGGAIVRSILRAGYQLWVYDLRPAAVEELAALGTPRCHDRRARRCP